MPKRQRGVEDRLDALEKQLTELHAKIARLSGSKAEIDSVTNDLKLIRAELARRGLGPIENPARRGPKLKPEEVSAIRRRNAALARAAKDVGRGQAKVRSTATKRKLEVQAFGQPTKKQK